MFFHKHLLQTATGKIPLAVFFWKEFAAKENIKITLFYSENSKNSQNSGDEKDPALLSQGRANFLGANKESSLPPQENEFVFDTTSARIKQVQTFSIILPNLIHKSRQKNLKT